VKILLPPSISNVSSINPSAIVLFTSVLIFQTQSELGRYGIPKLNPGDLISPVGSHKNSPQYGVAAMNKESP
jgi:hypothetical protein